MRQSFSGWIGCVLVLGLTFKAVQAQEDIDLGGPETIATMSQLNELFDVIALGLLFNVSVTEGADLSDDDFLVPLANYIDLNVIGQGQTVTLDPDSIVAFILIKQKESDRTGDLAHQLVAAFKQSAFTPSQAQYDQPKRRGPQTHIGGFFVGEFEHHQEPDGENSQLLEINQLRLYFAAELNPEDEANRVRVLAEWNPVAEEVIHHIDEIAVAQGGQVETLVIPDNDIEGLIPFEQLYARIENVARTGVSFTIGQFRNPFGLWSDYTSHRNFSSSKNNMLVNGFALKKIELGFLGQKAFANGLAVEVALVHGRQARTAPLDRADLDNKKDLVSRLRYVRPAYEIGGSLYWAEFSPDRNVAYGLHGIVPFSRLTLSGEAVWQKNSDVNETFGTTFSFDEVSSLAAYLQFDYQVLPKVHFYGFYETWNYFADGDQVNDPAYKVFHGLRYSLNPKVRWTVVEFGRMFHNDFDDGKIHLSAQLEVTF